MQEKVLVILLRVSGAILLIALIPAVMPFFWMQEIHRWLGMGELPAEPIVGYLTRSLSLMYAAHGALICFVSRDVRRFLPLVRFLAILSIVFGGGMIVLDAAVGMAAYWIVCEGPLIIPLGIVILLLANGVSFELASTIFRDRHALSIYDLNHSGDKERWIIMGIAANGALLVAHHTFAAINDETVVIRLFSSRKATRREQAQYAEQSNEKGI